jgi:hypothetical protein
MKANVKPSKLNDNCVNLLHYPVRVITLQLEETHFKLLLQEALGIKKPKHLSAGNKR